MAVAALIVALAAILIWLSFRLRRRSGLPEGEVIYSDTGAWARNEENLRSNAHGLVGKPDYLVRAGRHVIPVEVKATVAPDRPRLGHLLQLGAYCLLVEERFGARPPYGIIRYNDKSLKIPFERGLEQTVVDTLDRMRADAARAGGARRDHADARRCAACGVRDDCAERLEKPS